MCVLRRRLSDFNCGSLVRTCRPASVTSVFSSTKLVELGEGGQTLDAGVGDFGAHRASRRKSCSDASSLTSASVARHSSKSTPIMVFWAS